MTSLITAHGLSKAFGTQVLFENISFTLSSGDKIGLIGPNGAGKTSLIKILAGLETPDSGYVSKKQHLRIGYASQTPLFPSRTVEQFLISQIPHLEEHEAATRARILMGKAQFADYSADASLLSGGWKKRLDIVRALMNEPDYLFLDEPTNHLDLEGIRWLEGFLKCLSTPYLLISHDRTFLENTARMIIELNRCYPEGVLIVNGSMNTYKRQREDFLNQLEQKERGLAFKVREEVEWLRTSPKARTTKSQSRIRQAHEYIEELADVKQRSKIETAKIDFSATERQTLKLLSAKNISKTLGGKILFKNLDAILTPGTRLGIVGNNGAGKTTFLKVLSGALQPDSGTIKNADGLRIVYFDQHREQIPPDLTLRQALCQNGDTVNYRGKEIHVNGWAKRFLFSPERLNLPVGYLSGGERARILIAKLMLQPADLLFLDEPTNDLDIQTLEVIEDSLKTFMGAVVLISHDRSLMDSLCTQILALSEDGKHQFFASCSQWEEYQAGRVKSQKTPIKETPAIVKKPSGKLSYHEKKELAHMEQMVLDLESEIEELHQAEARKRDHHYYAQLGNKQKDLEDLYQRWQDLLDRS